MTPHNPAPVSVDDEMVERATRAFWKAYNSEADGVIVLRGRRCGRTFGAIRAAITEALAGGAEPVAWQYRYVMGDVGYWSGWAQCQSDADAQRLVERHAEHGQRAEYRRLYAAPPVAQERGQVDALVPVATVWEDGAGETHIGWSIDDDEVEVFCRQCMGYLYSIGTATRQPAQVEGEGQ